MDKHCTRGIKNQDGSIKPFYLKRNFKYRPNDKFELEIIKSINSFSKTPLSKIWLNRHMVWQGENLIAADAQKVKFIADAGYQLIRK